RAARSPTRRQRASRWKQADADDEDECRGGGGPRRLLPAPEDSASEDPATWGGHPLRWAVPRALPVRVRGTDRLLGGREPLLAAGIRSRPERREGHVRRFRQFPAGADRHDLR